MKDCLFYIPGFGSSSSTDKAQAFKDLADALGWDFVGLDYPDSYSPTACALKFCTEISLHPYHNAVFVGSSLGAFWALSLAKTFDQRAVVLNPSLQPGKTLARYVTATGQVTSFDGSVKSLTLDDCGKYLDSVFPIPTAGVTVILCKDDETLDYRVAYDAYKDVAKVVLHETGGHRGSSVLNSVLAETSAVMCREYE